MNTNQLTILFLLAPTLAAILSLALMWFTIIKKDRKLAQANECLDAALAALFAYRMRDLEAASAQNEVTLEGLGDAFKGSARAAETFGKAVEE